MANDRDMIYVVFWTLSRDMSHDPNFKEYLFSENEAIAAFHTHEEAVDHIRNRAKRLDIEIKDGPICWDGKIHSFKVIKDNGIPYTGMNMTEFQWEIDDYFGCVRFDGSDEICLRIEGVPIGEFEFYD